MSGSETGPGETRAKQEFLCRAIRDETAFVRTFVFEPSNGCLPTIKAGQFFNIAANMQGGTLWRSISAASSPLSGSYLELTIRRQRPGGATDWLHRHLTPGQKVLLDGPYGRFCPDDMPERPLLLISAGSGATPMASMVRWLVDARLKVPVRYVHFARSAPELLFKSELELIASRHGWLTLCWVVTEKDGRPGAGFWQELAAANAGADVFCCGPDAFMDSARTAFQASGPSARWHEESFLAAFPVEQAAGAGPDSVGEGHLVRFEPSGVEVIARPGETILVAGLRAGLPLKSSCGKGICSTCRLHKLSGEVEMQQYGGLFEDEVEAGDILACCSRPLGPVTLRQV